MPNDARFFWMRFIPTLDGPVAVDVRTAGLASFPGLLLFAAAHIAQQLSAEVLGKHPLEVEHQHACVFSEVVFLCIDNQMRVGA
jgi:hypothetical protein